MTVDEVTKNNQEEGRRRSRRRSRQATTKAPEAPAKQQMARKDKPTSTRRESEGKGNFITRPLRGIVGYFTATRAELQKVTWPTREESLRLSGIVIAMTIFFSLALGSMDYLYGQLFRLGFSTPVIFVIFAIVLVAVVGGGKLVLRRRSGL